MQSCIAHHIDDILTIVLVPCFAAALIDTQDRSELSLASLPSTQLEMTDLLRIRTFFKRYGMGSRIQYAIIVFEPGAGLCHTPA
jgi:hypothetical protein